MGIQIGTGSAAATLKKVMVGTGSAAVPVRKIMVGTGSAAIQVWADTVPMSMDKSGNQTGIQRNIWTLLTNWVSRSGYPDTVIAQDGLQVKAGTYNIDGLITYVSNDRRRWVRVYQNSTLLWEVNIGSTFVTSIAITGTGLSSVACGEGDLLTVEVMNDGGNDAVAGGVSTYLTATPV